MTSTPHDGVPAAALAEPDWHALEDELAPICDELAARYAALYDPGRRRTEYLARLEAIRKRDEQARIEHEAATQAAAQAAVAAAVRAASIEAGLEVHPLDAATDEVPAVENAAYAPTPALLPAWS